MDFLHVPHWYVACRDRGGKAIQKVAVEPPLSQGVIKSIQSPVEPPTFQGKLFHFFFQYSFILLSPVQKKVIVGAVVMISTDQVL